MGVYTIIYNFATASRIEKTPQTSTSALLSHFDLDLEEYFRGIAREIHSRMPNDDSELLAYYLSAYTRYSSGVAIINRQFAYLNRHFINRAIEEGMGWISLQDVLLKSEREKRKDGKKTNKDVELLDARKKEILRHWGFDGGSNEQRRFAESCAEANSPSEKIVPVASLAHRCWRLEVIEPFLSASKSSAETPSTNECIQQTINAAKSASPKNLSEVTPQLESFSSDGLNAPHFSPITPNPPLSRSAKKRIKRQNAKGKGKGKEHANGSGIEANVPNDVGELVLKPPQRPKNIIAHETALKLSKSLKASGVSPENIVRKRLDKFLKR